MKARDVMTTKVITVGVGGSVQDAAGTLLAHRVSAAPVVTDQGELVGLVSEGDLMRRAETETERRHSWWLKLFAAPVALATEFTKAHGR